MNYSEKEIEEVLNKYKLTEDEHKKYYEVIKRLWTADQYPVDLTIHDSYEHCVLCRFVARFSLHHLFVVRFYQSGPT